MPTVKKSNSRKSIPRRRRGLCAEDQRDQLNPPVTIEVLPNTVLLEIFSFYVDRRDAGEDVWHTLVHVCRQWRFVVFDSPRRLNLQLLCTPKRPLEMLDIWPALPIVVDFLAKGKRPRGMANIIAALNQHCRVRRICIRGIPNSLMKRFAAMEKPFPELTHLELTSYGQNVPILPDTFLVGSAPRLHTLMLYGISFPAVRELFLSIRNLVDLHLWSIPHSGYISPEEMVTCLSALTGLKVFVLGFRSPQYRVGGGTRHVPPLTHIVLATLTTFRFKGNCEYLEGIVSLIDTPLLDHFRITFFHQLIYDAPLLRHFISRTEIIKAHYRAHAAFHGDRAEVGFSPHGMIVVNEGLLLEISCAPSDWQLSSLAQVCSSSLLPLSTLEHFRIFSYRSHWQDDIESIQWLELLYPFTSVKHLGLSDGSVPLVAPALQELSGERVTEVLPMLQNLQFDEQELSGPAENAIRQFIDARQRSGRPIARMRQFNVTEALSYLDIVKAQFYDRSDYNVFLDIMKEFKCQMIDTPGVIQRVASLFRGHPSLIQGFNTFLPIGYRIEVGSDAQSSEVITITTPLRIMQPTTKPEPEPAAPGVPSPNPPTDSSSASAPTLMIAAPESPATIEKRDNAETAPQPAIEAVNGSTDWQLNVTDALSYLDAVKVQFNDRPGVYNVFLDIMKEFKSQVLDTPGAISRVASLFRGHPSLIQGFNKFLPIGYRIEVGSDAQSMVITVTTPSGTMLQSTNSPSIPPPPQSAPPLQELGQPSLHQPPLPLPLPSTSALGLSNALKASAGSIDVPSFDDQEHQGSEPTMDYHERQGLEPAMDYIRHIKTRFSNDPDTYKRFLGILASHKSRAENAQVFAKVQELFKDAPDLAAAFATSNLAIPEGQARDLGIRDADGLVSLFKVMNISEPSEEGD